MIIEETDAKEQKHCPILRDMCLGAECMMWKTKYIFFGFDDEEIVRSLPTETDKVLSTTEGAIGSILFIKTKGKVQSIEESKIGYCGLAGRAF
jgi:hypothetical protein